MNRQYSDMNDVPVKLDKTNIQIVEAVENMEARHGKASTADVAATVALSYRQTLRYLNTLADKGHVQRIGERGGWRSAA